uniref:Fibronectin type III domain-containing protein n=1 Tax=Candidatus Kentrum sp. LPFa TaxID=2126335 RepID=A0A450WWK6_9GAMM|nr:MAG: Fibronectin type III domain-containing protein [Candidatus Kentron sp. LPFa]
MAVFPSEEVKILDLGQSMSTGLKANTDIFPSPPVDTVTLDGVVTAYVSAKEAVMAAQAAAAQAAAKQAALQTMTDKIKLNLRYAEMIVNFDDAKLKTIGWGGRRGKTPLTPPGRVLDLVDTGQGEDWLKLEWGKPIDGGRVASYKVLCRERITGAKWKSEEITTSTEIILVGQPRSKELEYCVVAVNNAGEGPQSNTATVVL